VIAAHTPESGGRDERFHAESCRRILVVQTLGIGDTLVTTPALRALRRACPRATLDALVAAPSRDVLASNPDIDDIILVDGATADHDSALVDTVRARAYEAVFDFSGTDMCPQLATRVTGFSGAQWRVGVDFAERRWAYNVAVTPDAGNRYVADAKLDLLRALQLEVAGTELERIIVPEHRTLRVRQFVDTLPTVGLRIIMAPTSRRQARRWRLEGYAELGDALVDRYQATLILAWGPGEQDVVDAIAARMRNAVRRPPLLDLKELAYLCERSDLMIGNDNGPKHVAIAMGTPTLTVYGPSDDSKWSPRSERHVAIKVMVPCICCGGRECGTHECMEQLSAELILARFQSMLGTGICRASE
jgi:heptosyltransferase-3